MAPRISEGILNGVFDAFQADHVTTTARFWNHPELPYARTFFVPGNVELVVGGQVRPFQDGAIVFRHNGELNAIPRIAAEGGGVTVDGGPMRPVTVDRYSNRPIGNMSTLNFNEVNGPGTSQLSMHQPEGRGAGFLIRYPNYTPQEIAELAQRNNAVFELRNSRGETVRGFIAKNSGAVLQNPELGPYARTMNFDAGDFVSLRQMPNGETSVFTYKNYSADELALQRRMHGEHYTPGNVRSQLTMPDGSPINEARLPKLDVQSGLRQMAGLAPEGAVPEGGARTPEGGTRAPQVEGAPEVPGGSARSASALSRLGRAIAPVLAPAALAALPAYEGITDGYQAYSNGGSALDTAAAAAKGVAKGVVDTYLPGARDGYSNVIGRGDLTAVDRFLNAANDATGTATAIGATAMVAEAASVVALPAELPTAAATLAAGVANIGVNAAKGILKATGMAGRDQDGGYIYDAVVGAYNGASRLLGFDSPTSSSSNTQTDGRRAGFDVDHLLSRSTSLASNDEGRAPDRSDREGRERREDRG